MSYWLPNYSEQHDRNRRLEDIDYRISLEESIQSRDPLLITIQNEQREREQNWNRPRNPLVPESLEVTIGNELAGKPPTSADLIGQLGVGNTGTEESDLSSLLEQLAHYSNTYDAAEAEQIHSLQLPAQAEFSSRSGQILPRSETRNLANKDIEAATANRFTGSAEYDSRSEVVNYKQLESDYSRILGRHSQPTASDIQPPSVKICSAEDISLYEHFSDAPASVRKFFLTQIPVTSSGPFSYGDIPRQLAEPEVSVAESASKKPTDVGDEASDEQDRIKKVLEKMGFNFELSQKMQSLADLTRKKEQEVMQQRQKQLQQEIVEKVAASIPSSAKPQPQQPKPEAVKPPVSSQTQMPTLVVSDFSKPPPVAQSLAPYTGQAAAAQGLDYRIYPHQPPPPATESATAVVGISEQQQDFRKRSERDLEWEEATRRFEEKLKRKATPRRRSSSRSDEDDVQRKSRARSLTKRVEKRAEEKEKKLKEKEKAEKIQKEKEKAKEDAAKKKELETFIAIEKDKLKKQLESQETQLVAQLEKTRQKKAGDEKKSLLLRGELNRLKRQHGELCRKVQRQKDGHNDPLLVENARLQAAITKQLQQIDNDIVEYDRALSKLTEVRSKLEDIKKLEEQTPKKTEEKPKKEKLKRKDREDSSDSSKDKKKIKKAKQSSAGESSKDEKKIHYTFFDGGSYWCRECNVTCGTVFDFFQHLHTEKHKKLVNPRNLPWMPESVKDPTKKEAPRNVTIMIEPIKGVEFLVPCWMAVYCSLCKEISGDFLSAEDHLKSQTHGINYKKYIEENPLHERTQTLDKAAGISTAKSSLAAGQEIATEDIRVVVRNTEARKAQPGFGLMEPQQPTKADAGSDKTQPKFDAFRLVSQEGAKMQIKIPNTTGVSAAASTTTTPKEKVTSPSIPLKKVPGRTFQEQKKSPRREEKTRRTRWRSRSRSPSRRSSSRRRSLSPASKGGGRRRRSRSRSRSGDRRYRRSSRDIPVRTGPVTSGGVAPSAKEREKLLQQEEEKRKEKLQQEKEQEEKRQAQLFHSVRVAEAIKRQFTGSATAEDLKLLANYGKEKPPAKPGTMPPPTVVTTNKAGQKTQIRVPAPAEFLQRFRMATSKGSFWTPQQKGQAPPVSAASDPQFAVPLPPDQLRKASGKEASTSAPKQIELTNFQEETTSGDEEWHLSLPDTSLDSGSETDGLQLPSENDDEDEELKALASLAEEVVKDMKERREQAAEMSEHNLGIDFDDLEVVDSA